jgi:protein TonB
VPDPANLQPEYPTELQKKGITGLVVIKLKISATGRPMGAKILSVQSTATTEEDQKIAKELLLKAVISVVKGWSYTPSMLEGQPIETTVIIKFPFKLAG